MAGPGPPHGIGPGPPCIVRNWPGPPRPSSIGGPLPAHRLLRSADRTRSTSPILEWRSFASPWALPLLWPDQVHFERVYQVHRPCHRTPSEPGWPDQVHPTESDQVHLALLGIGLGPPGIARKRTKSTWHWSESERVHLAMKKAVARGGGPLFCPGQGDLLLGPI